MKYNLRMMTKDDIEAVIEGETKAFGKSLGYDFLLSELEINPFSQYVVLEIDGKVHGYMGLSITDNVQIINFYVDEEYQNMGFGTMMMEFVIDVCESSQASSITLEVRKSNTKALKLYQKFGLKEVLLRKGYYDNGEDAILMERKFEVLK